MVARGTRLFDEVGVAAIRRRKETETIKSLAASLGVSKGTIELALKHGAYTPPPPLRQHFSGDAVKAWIADMLAKGLATSEADCARQLGVTKQHLIRLKRNGTSRVMALACRALLDGREPIN